MQKYYVDLYMNSSKDEQGIENLRSSIVLLLRSNLRAKEYIYYLKSNGNWDYRGEEKDLKRRIEKDYALICKLSETARYDKSLEIGSDLKSIYSEENGKYRVNILESDINIFEKYEVTGKVVNKNGNSLEGVSINFINDKTDKELNSETDSNGNFSQKLKSGTYTLEISKDGYETKEMTVEVNGTQNDLGKITLDKDQGTSGKSYVGKWYYSIEYSDSIGSASEYYEINIKLINGNNIIFDYNFYPSSGMETLKVENPNINGKIINGKVDFTYEDLNYNNANGTIYLKNNNLYLSLNGELRYDKLNYQKFKRS